MRYLILALSLAAAGIALAEEAPKSVMKRIDKSTPVLMEAAPPSDGTATDEEEAGSRAQDHNSSRSNKTSSASGLHAEGVVHRDIAARQPGASDFGMSRATEARAAAPNQNEARSNRGRAAEAPPAEGADYNSSRSNKTHAPADGGGSGGSGGTRARDYNSSRSNISTMRGGDASDLDGTGNAGGTRAQDYNSSRSNTTTLREGDAADLDGDGRPDLVTCCDGVDQDCDGADASSTGAFLSKKGYDYYCAKSDMSVAPAQPASPAAPANHNTTRSNR